MARRLTISAALLLLSMPVAAATLRGRVATSIEALPGVTVRLARPLHRTRVTVTDANGVFVFESVKGAKYIVEAELVGLKMTGAPRTVLVGDADLDIEIPMTVQGTMCTIEVPARHDSATFTMQQSDANKLPLGH